MSEAARLFIVGAGGLGREFATWARDAGFDIRGFLDHDPHALDGTRCEIPIVGREEEYSFQTGDRAVIAMGDPQMRAEVSRKLSGKVEFATVIHPSATVGPHCQLGPGSVVCPGAVLTCDVEVGVHTVINIGSVIAHDARLGDHCTLCPHAEVMGRAQLGDRVFLGTQAVVIPSVEIASDAIVGAGAVVLKSVDPGVTAVGNTARPK